MTTEELNMRIVELEKQLSRIHLECLPELRHTPMSSGRDELEGDAPPPPAPPDDPWNYDNGGNDGQLQNRVPDDGGRPVRDVEVPEGGAPKKTKKQSLILISSSSIEKDHQNKLCDQ
eukprot:16443509-Heterocapsa_arctica.AAC.1